MLSLRGRRFKGKGKGVLGARETRGAREEGFWFKDFLLVIDVIKPPGTYLNN